MYDFEQIYLRTNQAVSNSILQVNVTTASSLCLEDGEKTCIFAGKVSVELTVKINNKQNAACMVLNPVVLKKLHLQSNTKYGIAKQEDGVHIGPVIGIIADYFGEKKRPFGGQSFFISQLITASRRMGVIAFAFSPYNINYNKRTVNGYSYGKNGWIRKTYPLPDVVYPRVSGYSYKGLQVRRRMEKYGCLFINPPLIGKWQTYKIISKNPELLPHIPDTNLVSSFRPVDRMIRKYRAVYIKPVKGSQGKNIVKVVKKKNSSRYEYQYRINNNNCRGSSSSINGLQTSLKKIMGNRTYIVQQQINLLKSDKNNVIDVRILVQKDNTGKWKITGKACRVGRRGSITSNISSGGSGHRVEKVLANHFADQEQINNIINKIECVALEAAKTMETEVGSIGELGIDIGVDNEGAVWFIEANIRPARQVFSLIGEKDIRRKSVERPLLYGCYLAGFSQEGYQNI